jgi:hypothetical protein
LAGTLKVERQFGTYEATPLAVLKLPTRALNALLRQGVRTIETLEWLLLPENLATLHNFRQMGEVSFNAITEKLAAFREDN